MPLGKTFLTQTYHSILCFSVLQGLTDRTYLLVALTVKNLPTMWDTWVQFLGEEGPPEGNGYPLQYSCLENSMSRGAWQAIVHGVTKSWT